jgi:signal transduction histidine kinase
MVQVTEAVSAAKPHGVHLRSKVLLALAISSALPLTFALLFDSQLGRDEETRRVFLEFVSTPLDIYGYPIRFYTIFVLALFGVSMAAAGAYIDWMFVHPIHKLTKWVEETRKQAFENVPVMPEAHSRDIAELERGIASALAYSADTRNQNANLSTKKDELVVIAAHQLRTPLTGLKWAVSTLQNSEMTAAERIVRTGEIQETVQRIGLIVDNIVASADIEEGKFGYSFSNVDIIDVIKHQIENLALSVKQREQKVVTNFPEGKFIANIDAYRMATAIYNVLENAVEYTPQGGAITVSFIDNGTNYELIVEDSGIGIPEFEMQHLFAKFYRGENAKHMRPNGSGLGLYLAKHVVESHGGKVWLQSIEGKGTKVTLPIPYQRKEEKPKA